MLVRKSAFIWQRSWSFVLNIFQDCFRIDQFQASVAYKNACESSLFEQSLRDWISCPSLIILKAQVSTPPSAPSVFPSLIDENTYLCAISSPFSSRVSPLGSIFFNCSIPVCILPSSWVNGMFRVALVENVMIDIRVVGPFSSLIKPCTKPTVWTWGRNKTMIINHCGCNEDDEYHRRAFLLHGTFVQW